jgi:hypothetical protein
MQLADKTAIAGIVAGLAGGVMTALLDKIFPGTPLWLLQSLFALSGLALVFSFAVLVDEHVCKPRLRRALVGPALLIIISTLGFIAGVAWAITGKVPIVAGPAAPPTLEDLYAKAFNYLNLERKLHFEVADKTDGYKTSIEIRFRIYEDFESNSYFASIYIPTFHEARLSQMVPYIIGSLRDHVRPWCDDLRTSIVVGAKSPGTSYVASNNMQFSSRVFIFTLNSLDQVELGDLVSWYRADGMALEIRGHDYWVARWKD